MDCMYVQYGQITPGYIMKNQEEFNKIETGKELEVEANSPFSDQQLVDMGVAKSLATQEYTHSYRMWKIIANNDRKWLQFKAHFQ